MTTADDKGEFVDRGPDRRQIVERRKSPRLSFDGADRRQGERRTAEDRRRV